MKSWKARLVAAIVVAHGGFILVSCSQDQREQNSTGTPLPNDAAPPDTWVPPIADAQTDEPDAGLPVPDAQALAGWHLWEHVPQDTAIFVPDDVSTVLPLEWKACPFQPVGCERAGAPWATHSGWGFGTIALASCVGTDAYLAFGRGIQKDWNEIVVTRNSIPVGAWRYHIPNSRGRAFARAGLDGQVGVSVMRYDAENAPVVFLGPPDTIINNPARIERFGPPDAALLPTGVLNWSEQFLVLWENYGRFTVRDLESGVTYRPEPPVNYQYLEELSPVQDSVFYGVWNGGLASIWLWTSPGQNQLVLGDDTYSYDFPSSDGEWISWLRGYDQLGTNQFTEIELWASPLGNDLTVLQPRKIADVPGTWLALTSVGEGWVAMRNTFQDVRVYRLTDGEERRLPVVDDLDWLGDGRDSGLVVSQDKVWLTARPSNHGNSDALWIFRFDVNSLATFPP